MRIAYEDIVPEIVTPAAFLQNPMYETFDHLIARANKWIDDKTIDVINVETVAFPQGRWGPTQSNAPAVAGNVGSWHQFLRIWYRD